MSHYLSEKHSSLDGLVFEYEVASQKGAVPFLEETVFVRLADHFEKIQQLGKAQSILSEGLTQHPKSSELYLRRAELLLQNNQADEARRWLEKTEAVLPEQYRTKILRAEAYCKLGNVAQAMTLLRELRQTTARNSPKKSTEKSHDSIFENLQKISQKFRRLRDILMVDPDNEAVLTQLWGVVELSFQFEQSAVLHENLIDLNPYSWRAWFNLGSAWSQLDREQDALEAFEYAYLINPDFQDAYEAFGALAFQLGEYKLALRAYQEMIDRIGESSNSLVRVGECFEKLGNRAVARTFYSKAILADFTCSEGYFLLGQGYYADNLLGKAINYFKKTVELSPKNEIYQITLAESFAEIGDAKQAVFHFRKATLNADGVPTYWIRYATFFAKIKQWKKALRVLDDGEVNSYGADLAFCRSAALILSNRRAEGLELLDCTLAEDFSAHEILFTFAPELAEDADIRAMIADFEA
jgi:tetratricopeptide (TPR) repeat protein